MFNRNRWVAEVAKKINSKIYINVQGDEPLVNPKDIKKIISQKIKYPKHIICGFAKIRNFENPTSKNIPKVVMNKNNELVYILRALVPSSKKSKIQFYKQVCIYAFNKTELTKFSSMKNHTREAWRHWDFKVFDLGIKIKMVKLSSKTLAVDVKSDIKVEKFYKMKKIYWPKYKNKSITVEKRLQFVDFDKKSLPYQLKLKLASQEYVIENVLFVREVTRNLSKKEFISNKLHLKLCNELKAFNYRGTIRYSGFVEPLLDKNIFNLIKMAKDKLPDSNIELVTNGDVLNLARLKKLFTHGLNKILISAYDGKKEADVLEELCLRAKLKSARYIVRHGYLHESQDFGITLSNRSGSMQNAEYKIESLKEPLKKPCFIPSYTFFRLSRWCFNVPTWLRRKIILGN